MNKNIKFLFIGSEEYILPVAYHLQQEGYEVIVGCIVDTQSPDVALHVEETLEEKKQRLSNYSGLLKIYDHRDVLNMLEAVEPKDRKKYFFFFDYNDTYPIAERLLKMGFTQGLFPTKFYFELEKNRNRAREFVKAHYPDIKIAEDHEFQSAEDGIAFLEETDGIWVLKSNGSYGRTIVPRIDDPELAKAIIIDALTQDAKEYEKEGFLLEQKILNAREVTPIKLYYDGKPICTVAEFENKEYGAGNIGIQKGGNQALTVRTPMYCRLNQMAFPPIIDTLAKAQPGLAVFDAGLLYDGVNFWFSEFAGMRFGYDGLFSILVMRSEGQPFVGDFFQDILNGATPIRNRYGAYVRLFNLNGAQVETKPPQDDLPMMWPSSIDRHLFLYRSKKVDDRIVSVGGADLIGCITGHGDDLERCVSTLYSRVEQFSFEKLYNRPKFDFLSRDYSSSILNRVAAIEPFFESMPEEETRAVQHDRQVLRAR